MVDYDLQYYLTVAGGALLGICLLWFFVSLFRKKKKKKKKREEEKKMTYGIEAYTPTGETLFRDADGYVQVIDRFNPLTVGMPGSRSYPGRTKVRALGKPGGGVALTVAVTGNTVSWANGDPGYTWAPFSSSTAEIVVFGGVQ